MYFSDSIEALTKLADVVKSMVLLVSAGVETAPNMLTIVKAVLNQKCKRLEVFNRDHGSKMSEADIEEVLQVCFWR